MSDETCTPTVKQALADAAVGRLINVMSVTGVTVEELTKSLICGAQALFVQAAPKCRPSRLQ
jgi:hypothetical protein